MREREAFQELDYRAVFGTMAKWATEIDDPTRIPEIVSRAFHIACNGRPGPVVMALPEDMLTERALVCRCARVRAGGDLARPHRHEPVAEDALGGQAPDRAARRQPLVGSRLRRDACASPNALRCRWRPRSAASICSTQTASLLCGRSRHRPQSEIAGAREGRRSAAADRRPDERDAVAELHRCSTSPNRR